VVQVGNRGPSSDKEEFPIPPPSGEQSDWRAARRKENAGCGGLARASTANKETPLGLCKADTGRLSVSPDSQVELLAWVLFASGRLGHRQLLVDFQ
jgi:hypothetical protein